MVTSDTTVSQERHMSLKPDTIAIRNKPFVKRVIRFAKANKQKTLSSVVQGLAEAELSRIENGLHSETTGPVRGLRSGGDPTVTPASTEP